MSELYWVICPHCDAAGQFSDPKLKGQEAFCPVCGEAFVVQAASPPQFSPQISESHPGNVSTGSKEEATTRPSVPRSSAGTSLKVAVLGAVASVAVALVALWPKPPAPQAPAQKRDVAPEQDVAIDQSAAPQVVKKGALALPSQPTETINNIPIEAQREIERAFEEVNIPALSKLLEHPHAGVRESVADDLRYRIDAHPALVPALLPRLDDPSLPVRGNAIAALLRHGVTVPEVIPALGKVLLESPIPDFRTSAAKVLKDIAASDPERAKAVAVPILTALDDESNDPFTRSAVIEATGYLGAAAKPAIPTLIQLSKDFRFAAAFGALAQLGRLETFPAVLANRDSDEYLAKGQMAEGIGRMRPMSLEALAIIKTLSEDENKMIRLHAIEALVAAEPKLPEALPLLEKAQTDADRYVREAGANGIAKYGSDDPVRNMRRLLNQMITSEDATWYDSKIADAMKSMGTKGFGALVQILEDPQSSPEIRTAAGQVLAMNWNGDWHDPEQVFKLKTLYLDPKQSLTIRTGCAIALLNLETADSDFGPTLFAAMLDPKVDFQVRQFATMQAAYKFPNLEQFVPTLVAAARQCEAAAPADMTEFESRKRQGFYWSVVDAMSKVDAWNKKETTPHLVAAARQKDSMVRSEALDAIRLLREWTPEVVEVLRESLNGNRISEQALNAIGSHRDSAASLIPEVRAALKSDSSSIRSAAVDALGDLGPTAVAAVPDLIKLFTDEKNDTARAGKALAEIAPRDETVIALLVQALDDPKLRGSALAGLVEIGAPAGMAVPKLQKLLAESPGELRGHIIRTLGTMGEAAKPAIPDLIRELADRDQYIRYAAVSALGQLKHLAEPAVPEIVKLLNDPEESVQSTVLWSLSRIGPAATPAIPEIEKFLAATSKEDLKKDATGLLTLLKSDPGDADPALFAILMDDTKWRELSENESAVRQQSIPELWKLSLNSNPDVQQRARSLLDTIFLDPEGKAKLQDFLKSPDIRTRAAAAVSLNQLPADGDRLELARALVPWLSTEPTLWIAAPLLIQIGPTAQPLLATALLDEKTSPAVRRRIVTAYFNREVLDENLLLPLLRPALKAENPETRKLVALAISELNPGDREALPLVVECLQDTDRDSKLAAVQAIRAAEGLDGNDAVPHLIKITGEAATASGANPYGDTELLYGSAGILSNIGARPEDLPALRAILTKTLALLNPEGRSEFTSNDDVGHRISHFGLCVVQVLGTLGPAVAETLPDIRTLLASGYGLHDEEAIDGYGQGLAGMSDPALQMLIDLAKQQDAASAGRQLAIALLGFIDSRDERVVATLTTLLTDAHFPVRFVAAKILAEHSSTFEIALPVLREALRTASTDAIKEGTRTRIIRLLDDAQTITMSIPAIPELLALVKDEESDDNLRARAAIALMKIAPDGDGVRAAFLECLHRVSLYDAQDMLDDTTQLPVSEIVADLVRATENGDPISRNIAVRLLGHLGDKATAALPQLRALMTKEQAPLAANAAIAIARIDSTVKDVVPRVMDVLINSENDHYDAQAALKNLGPNAAEVIPKLIEFTQDPTLANRAFPILGRMGTAVKPALPTLRDAVFKPTLGYMAAHALSELGPDAAELGPYFLERLKAGDESPYLALAMSNMGEPAREAVEVLRKRLQQDQHRILAAERLDALGAVAAPAVPDLIKLANSENERLRRAAQRAIYSISPTSADTAQVIAVALSDPDPQVRQAAERALGKLGEHSLSILPQVITATEKSRGLRRSQFVVWLGRQGPAAKEAIPALTKLEKVDDLRLRAKVRDALKSIRAAPGT